MGFYLRKALTVGPFRFNLSKSGVGVSAGIPGLRFGKGPRGNYVHMGRGGMYYRKTLPAGESNKSPEKTQLDDVPHSDITGNMTEIDSADINQMVDSSSADLVAEMNAKSKKNKIWPYVLFTGLFAIYYLNKEYGNDVITLSTFVATLILTFIISIKDKLRKTTILFFDLENESEKLYQDLHNGFDQLKASNKKWHINSKGDVKDQKKNAGASTIITRNTTRLGKGNPINVKTNVSAPFIPVGTQTLYFYPDKILIVEKNQVGAVSYPNLNIDIESSRFVEEERVPQDSEIVDTTWKYVNKRGGPDKRFKDNKELPIVLYENIYFTSETGLNELISISKVDASENFVKAITELAKYCKI